MWQHLPHCHVWRPAACTPSFIRADRRSDIFEAAGLASGNDTDTNSPNGVWGTASVSRRFGKNRRSANPRIPQPCARSALKLKRLSLRTNSRDQKSPRRRRFEQSYDQQKPGGPRSRDLVDHREIQHQVRVKILRVEQLGRHPPGPPVSGSLIRRPSTGTHDCPASRSEPGTFECQLHQPVAIHIKPINARRNLLG